MIKASIAIVLILTAGCNKPIKGYNDWFDMNLKGKPKYIMEITCLPLIDSMLLIENNSNRTSALIHEFSFNANGRLTQEYYANVPDQRRDTIKYFEPPSYMDSLSVTGFSTVGDCGFFKETRIFDKEGFLICRIASMDTIKYHRNFNKKIDWSFEKLIGIDSPLERTIEYSYNDNGDISHTVTKEFSFWPWVQKPDTTITLNEYKYIYDENSNWIIQICLENSKITSITQRKLAYY